MKAILKQLSEVVAKANDSLYSKHAHVDTLMGIMDKALRNQGMNADAITIDCVAADKKIVLLLHDEQPDVVEVALGNKQGDIYSSTHYALSAVSEALLMEIMEENFID